MEKLLEDLQSLDEWRRQRAVQALVVKGTIAFDHIVPLLTHDVAKWEVLGLLPRISPVRSIPILLEYVRHNREVSTKTSEHSQKYIRIKAIEELGNLAMRRDPDVDALLAQNNVVDDLAYFIDPYHPHMHEEVHFAAVKALEKLTDMKALQKIENWKQYTRSNKKSTML